MGGRITSRDLGLNEYGVPYAKILELEREAHRRHLLALTEALRRWVALERVRRQNAGPEIEQLHREALELTQKALS
jgi:hypothetical protein